MKKKLIGFIKKIHWKIYGKNHLLNRLHEEFMSVARAYYKMGMKKDGYLYTKLHKLSNAIDDVKACEFMEEEE